MNLRLVLTILRAIVSRGTDVTIAIERESLLVDSEPLAGDVATVSEAGCVARIQRVARRLGLPLLYLPALQEAWERALQSQPHVAAGRLIELSRRCTAGQVSGTEPIDRWRQELETRLFDAFPNVERVERLVPGSPSVSARTLELAPMLRDWPERLLTQRQWAFADSPFDSVQPMPLDDIWVDIQFLPLEEMQRTALEGSLHEAVERRYVERMSQSVSPEFVVETFRGIVVLIGDPGIGKTTFLKWVARQLLRHPEGRYILPLVVPLRRYALSSNQGGGLLGFAIQQCGIHDEEQRSLWQNTLGYFAEAAHDTVLLLLDGWDEVPADRREALLQEVQDLSYQFTIVITSRPSASPLSLSADQYYEITELSPESTNALMDRWFQNVGRSELASLLQGHLDAHPDLRRLARNPFLLTVLCGIHFQAQESAQRPLPTTRSELYRQTLDIIRISHDRRYPAHPFDELRQRQVERFAGWLFSEAPDAPRYVFDGSDVQACCGEMTVLNEVLRPSRLLSQWDFDRETYHFVHTTFHEYLTAHDLLRRPPDQLAAVFENHQLDATWQEVFAFVAGESTRGHAAFWESMTAIAQQPDRLGMVFVRLARFVREAGVRDGGQLLLGIDLREALWRKIQGGVQRSWFISRCADLDVDWYVTRCRQSLDSPESPQTELQADLLRSLNELRTPESSRLLVEQLLTEGHSSAIASYAANRLTAEGIHSLRKALNDSAYAWEVRRRVIRALGCVRDFESIPEFQRLAGDDHEVIRRAALEALSVIGGLRAFETLEDLLTNATDESRRTEIYAALGEMREARARNRLLDALTDCPLDDPRAQAILDALIDNPITRDSAIVVDFLHHSPFAEVRASAAWVLATSHEHSVTDDLVEAARDEQEDADVRRGALAALRQHARPTEVDWLAEAVRNPQLDSSWRANALEAILAVAFRCRDSRSAARVEYIAAKLVHEVLETDFEDLKLAAAQFSDRLGDEIAPLLVQVCQRSTEPVSVREAACQSLGKLKYAPAVDVLLRLQREPQITRIAEAAASALTQINPIRLLGETTASAEKALAEFCLRTGCLIFDDRIINARGRRLIWSGQALEAEQVSDTPSNLVFLSYCRKDHIWLAKLQTMLSPLADNQTLSVWHDGDIEPGEEWLREIHKAMKSTKVAVLLVSDNFLASDFITQVELPFFVEAAKRKQVTLLWVLVKNCLYKQTPLVDLQAAHDVSRPLNSLSDPELHDVLVDLCETIAATTVTH